MSIFVQFLLVDRLAVYTMLRLIQRSNTAPRSVAKFCPRGKRSAIEGTKVAFIDVAEIVDAHLR